MANRKLRVGVSGHDLKFWYPLQRALELTGRYEFREDVWRGHNGHDLETSRALVEWADVLMAEWVLGNAVWYARNKRPEQRLVMRWHLQERLTDFPNQIDWSKVDRVAFVGPHILRECVSRFSIPPEICELLGNFVDVDAFALPKMGGADTTIGLIGTAPSRKRLDLAVETLEHLLERDPRYVLRVKGANPATIPWLWRQPEQRAYYERIYAKINAGPLRHKVIFDPPANDVQHWLRMIGAVVSPSDFESFHMAVAEGAASGALPVVWNWEGAGEIYPEFPLVGSAEEAANRIDANRRGAAGARLCKQAREVIRDRYGAQVIMQRWDGVLSGQADGARITAAPSPGRDVLVVWAIDSWPTFHRREMLRALAANLADTCDLLVVEPGNHFATVERLGWAPQDELRSIAAQGTVREDGNIWRTRLFTGGIGADVPKAPFQGASDDALVVLDGVLAHAFPNARNILHWVYKPDQAQRLGDARPFVYEVYDDYTIGFGNGEHDEAANRMEQAILPVAQHVFFTSQPLRERKGATARASSLVGNGVALEVFARYRLERSPRAGRPAAGYLGNLSDFFDWALMEGVCTRMPEVDFHFHGTVEIEKLGDSVAIHDRLRNLPNVRFTGRVGREHGAAAINRYDALLIPFVVNDAMHAVNPLKLWEYFATGLPVVSTPMDAIEDGAPALVVADGEDAWVAAIQAAIEDTDASARALRIARAQAHDWAALTRAHAGVVAGVCDALSPGDRESRLVAS
jgi:glycosyltransferase involved in cell wall biosynthesis